MRKPFVVNNELILTLLDLQRNFNPWDVCEQLPAFDAFALVHALALELQYIQMNDKGEKKYKYATYLNKRFYLSLLRQTNLICTESPWQIFSAFLEQSVASKICLQKIYEQSEEEQTQDEADAIDDENRKVQLQKLYNETFAEKMKLAKQETHLFDIEKKLAHIEQAVRQKGELEDSQLAIRLLSICEICEMNPLTLNFQRVDKATQNGVKEQSVGAPLVDAVQTSYPFAKKQGGATVDSVEILPFLGGAIVPLVTRTAPYRYVYHDQDVLSQGAKITTVRVEAKEGENEYANVCIELCNAKTNACVQKIILKKGEYRYLNVSDGKVITCLPLESKSATLQVQRCDPAKKALTITANKASAWQIDSVDASSFSASEENVGFLLIQDGLLIPMFYKEINDYVTQIQLNVIVLPAVEVYVNTEGYAVLLENGSVYSNLKNWEGKTKVVSLNRGR